MGTCIGLASIVDQTRRLSSHDRKTIDELVSTPLPPRWPEVDRDVFLSVNGLTAVTTHSRKSKPRHVTAWLIRRVLPRVHETVIKKQQNKITKHRTESSSVTCKGDESEKGSVHPAYAVHDYRSKGLAGGHGPSGDCGRETRTQATNTTRRPRPERMLSSQLEEGSSRKKRQRIVNFLTLKYIFPTNTYSQ